MNMMMVNYTCSIILDNFDWSTSEVKKKLSLAVLLSDITLNKEDFALLRKYEDNDYDKLPEHILNHPTEIGEIIRTSRHYGVPMEVAQIIEQHHEMPGRKGFPNQLDHSRITLFSAVQIVSYHFIKELTMYNFDYAKLDDIITRMKAKFQHGNFSKVLKVLLHVLTD
jgi:response regulator RpfG family c-di-GMP phosphodiesterase